MRQVRQTTLVIENVSAPPGGEVAERRREVAAPRLLELAPVVPPVLVGPVRQDAHDVSQGLEREKVPRILPGVVLPA
jgi:hypothetical protein